MDPRRALQVGMDLAALTHGHPTGYIAAGAFAVIISSIIKGTNIERAVRVACDMQDSKNSEETTSKIKDSEDIILIVHDDFAWKSPDDLLPADIPIAKKLLEVFV